MFIQTEATPNPDTIKIMAGEKELAQGTYEFFKSDEVSGSPLADKLLQISDINKVFICPDYISVTKSSGNWDELRPSLLEAVMGHMLSDEPVISDNYLKSLENSDKTADTQLVAQIKELIDTRVKPVVHQDGGDIIFHSYDDNIVYLKMMGACSGCPSSTATLKDGIERLLCHFIPEIQEVRAI